MKDNDKRYKDIIMLTKRNTRSYKSKLIVNGQVAHDVDIDRYLTEKHNDLEVQ